MDVFSADTELDAEKLVITGNIRGILKVNENTEVVKATHGGSGNYDKTVNGVSGGQWIIIEVYGLETANSNGYFFRVTQEA